MSTETGEKSSRNLFVLSLAIAFSATWVIESLTGVFLIDISLTFFNSADAVWIAAASQLVTISSVVSVISGLMLGVLSVRFSHKSLLLIGLLCVTFGILGCFLAPEFIFMQIFYPIEGIGTVIVSAMAFALVGEVLILKKRAAATGWIISSSSITGIVASILISIFFAGGGDGWRYYLLWFALPVSFIATVATYLGVPSSFQRPKNIGRQAYLNSLKQVFLKKSAVGCLVGNMFRQAGFAWAVVYSASFFRIVFGFSLGFAALIVLGGTALFALGSIFGGHLVNRVGRKRQVVASLVLSAPFLMLLAFVPYAWVALALHFSGAFIYSLGFPGSVNLTLEQAPNARGTMMSMSTIFLTLGLGVGTAIGGTVLALFGGYTELIFTFAAISLIAAAVYFFLTKDPCRP